MKQPCHVPTCCLRSFTFQVPGEAFPWSCLCCHTQVPLLSQEHPHTALTLEQSPRRRFPPDSEPILTSRHRWLCLDSLAQTHRAHQLLTTGEEPTENFSTAAPTQTQAALTSPPGNRDATGHASLMLLLGGAHI